MRADMEMFSDIGSLYFFWIIKSIQLAIALAEADGVKRHNKEFCLNIKNKASKNPIESSLRLKLRPYLFYCLECVAYCK
jgi:hypothetical protein